MGAPTLVYPCDRIPLRNKKQIIDAGNNMDESQKHCTEEKEQIEKRIFFMIQYIGHSRTGKTNTCSDRKQISGYPEVDCKVEIYWLNA